MYHSMLLSVAAYTFIFGPWVSIGLVLMMFVHEMGHVAALRLQGSEVRAPIFIPFLGAVIFGAPAERRDDEAFMAIGGPLLGSFAAILVFAGWTFIEDKQGTFAQNVLQVSMIGVGINLFNLIPISPLDGGRITQAVGSWFVYVGLVLLLWLTVVVALPIVWLLWLLLIPRATVFPQKVRFVLAVLIWGTMVTQLLFGSVHQSWISGLMFSVIGALLVLACKSPRLDEQHLLDAARPKLPLAQRFLWLCCYVALVVILVMVLKWQMPFLIKPPAQ